MSEYCDLDNILFYDHFTKYCPLCNFSVLENMTVHMTLFCKTTEHCRRLLWSKLSMVLTTPAYVELISLDPRSQLIALLSGVRADSVDQCLKIVVVFFHAVYQQIRNALFQSLP